MTTDFTLIKAHAEECIQNDLFRNEDPPTERTVGHSVPISFITNKYFYIPIASMTFCQNPKPSNERSNRTKVHMFFKVPDTGTNNYLVVDDESISNYIGINVTFDDLTDSVVIHVTGFDLHRYGGLFGYEMPPVPIPKRYHTFRVLQHWPKSTHVKTEEALKKAFRQSETKPCVRITDNRFYHW